MTHHGRVSDFAYSSMQRTVQSRMVKHQMSRVSVVSNQSVSQSFGFVYHYIVTLVNTGSHKVGFYKGFFTGILKIHSGTVIILMTSPDSHKSLWALETVFAQLDKQLMFISVEGNSAGFTFQKSLVS